MKRIIVALLSLVFAASALSAESAFSTIEDLDGRNIGVQTAVLYEELIMDRVPNATFQYYTMPNDMILALQSGKVDAYLIEEVSYGVQKKNHPDLTVLDEVAGYINATMKNRTGSSVSLTHSLPKAGRTDFWMSSMIIGSPISTL